MVLKTGSTIGLDKDIVGTCTKMEGTSRIGKTYIWQEIKILRPHFEESLIEHPNKAKIVVYHELGHCILGLNHSTNHQLGIMSEKLDGITGYENFDEYVEEMMSSAQQKFSFLDPQYN
ncbi:MAG: hypothetical protein HRU09_13505 [Oligoflexales bacterium]|nr:hypothetical protein [Oligoflexales bacterium]